jgi:phage gpG-like protein
MAEEGIQGLSRLLARIGRLATDTRHVEKLLKAAGVYMVGSVERNFQAQGRPKKWQALAASTLKRRRKGRRSGDGRLRDAQGRFLGKGGGGQILIDTAAMKNAVNYRVRTDGVEIGLSKVQAARQQFGYPGGTGRGHSHTPARPFLMIQDEDKTEIQNLFRRHLNH